MPFDTPFLYLPEATVRFIREPDYEDLYATYVDGLALIHDLLGGLGSAPEPPVFGEVERINHLLRELLGGLAAGRLPGRADAAEEARANLRFNRETARDLRGEFFSPSRSTMHYNTRLLVDAFVDDILEQYRILRHPDVFLKAKTRALP